MNTYIKLFVKKLFPSMFGYDNFPKSSSLSVNNIICHSIPYNYKLLEEDIVSIDVCGYNGFHNDNAHTYSVSNKVSGNNIALIETTKNVYILLFQYVKKVNTIILLEK